MSLPGALIFVNNDLSDNVQDALVRQLFIHQVMTGADFDGYVDGYATPTDYTDYLHGGNIRVLVKRDFNDVTNRDLADVVIFVKAGLAAVETNKFGPPGLTLPVDKLYIHRLLL